MYDQLKISLFDKLFAVRDLSKILNFFSRILVFFVGQTQIGEISNFRN